MLALLLACTTSPPGQPERAPIEVRMVAGSGARHHHVRTGPTWDAPNIPVGDAVFITGAGQLEGEDLVGELDAPAAFTAGSELVVEIDLPGGAPRTVGGALRSSVDPDFSQALVAQTAGEGETTLRFPPVRLPSRVDTLTLTLDYERFVTTHPIVLVWGTPIEGTPLYERSLLWGAEWFAGEIARDQLDEGALEAAEDRMALATLRGIEALGHSEGRSYGPFKRPKDKDNQAHVWLDHPRSACGEYRGGFMNLVESQGVDAQWVMMSFRDPGPERFSMYETREIAAVGTEPRVWQHWNHVAVEVNGQLYDPTYALHHPSWGDYEDDLFERYCTGEAEKCKTPGGWCQQPRPEGSCVDNPPGFDPEDPRMAMKVWRGDDY